MINLFRKNGGSTANGNASTAGLTRYGCVSRRDKDATRHENDAVVVVKETDGALYVSKFSRRASLETLRLNGLIRTCAANYRARTVRLTDLQYSDATDEIKIGSAFISYLKGQKVNLQEKCAAFTLDATGTVAGITAPEKDVAEAAVSVEGFRARPDQSCPVEVETRARAALRLFLRLRVPVRQDHETALPETICTAVIEDHGYSLIIWNEQRGVCWEAENPFSNGGDPGENWVVAADDIDRSLSPVSLESIGISAVNRIVIAAEENCLATLKKELAEKKIAFENFGFDEGVDYSLTEGSQAVAGNSRIDALVAAGLLFEDARLPAVNLNRDLELFIREREQERVRAAERKTAVAHRNLTILLASPAVVMIACAILWYAMLWIQDSYVERRYERAKAEDARLKDVKAQIQKVKESSDNVKLVSEAIGTLKKRQPANFLLLMALNRKWNSLGSWQIDEITSKPDGTVTIKGKTNSDDNLTEFAKSLDFSDDFQTVKVSKGEGAALGGGAPPSGSFPTAGSPGGIIKFAVETRFMPLAAFGATPNKPSAPGPTAPLAPAGGAPPPPQVANGGVPKPPNG